MRVRLVKEVYEEAEQRQNAPKRGWKGLFSSQHSALVMRDPEDADRGRE